MSPHIRTRIAIAIAFFLAILGIIVVPRILNNDSHRRNRTTSVGATAASQTASPQLNIKTTTASPSSNNKNKSPLTAPGGLSLLGNTLDTFTLAWNPPSPEGAAVAHYLVAVNGTVVAIVSTPSAELVWPGGTTQVLVQVAAVDDSGNQSPWSAVWIIPPAGVPLIPKTSPSAQPTSAVSEPAVPLPTSDIARPTASDIPASSPATSPTSSEPNFTALPQPSFPSSSEPTSTTCPPAAGTDSPCSSITPTITASPPASSLPLPSPNPTGSHGGIIISSPTPSP